MNKREILIVDTVTKLGPEAYKNVVIAGSHGGVYAGFEAATARVRGIILHDAGVGLDNAGIGSLSYLDNLEIAAAVIDYRTAVIGNGQSLASSGRISFVNDTAAKSGCSVGQASIECANAMKLSTFNSKPVPVYEEARFIIRDGSDGIIVRGCDSVSLVKEEDEDTVVITASHGEVLASSPTWGSRPSVLGAVFNDAGSNLVSRLPDLDKLGIPAVTVSCSSAKIGDARSTYNDGIISHSNKSAKNLNVKVGMTTIEFVEQINKNSS